MIASENVISPSVRRRLASDFECRYGNAYAPTLSTSWEAYERVKWYEGLEIIAEVEKICHNRLRELFKADYADYRPISGSAAILAVWLALTNVGDTIMTTDEYAGGHGAGWDESALMMGRKIEHWPFDSHDFTIDIDAAKKVIRKIRPRLLVFGGSQLLFPAPVKELRGEIDDTGLCVFDGSHVLGLIAGKHFQDPLREGADVLFGSTHKSFPGPQGGTILSNAKKKELSSSLDRTLDPALFDNYHQHRVAALAVATAEMIQFGEKYAQQTIGNAQSLAGALHDEGIPVLCAERGFTASHQVLLEVRRLGREGAEVARELAASNIITNKVHLPEDPEETRYGGVRLGTSELTRTGAGPEDMKDIARLYRKIILDRIEPRIVKPKVRELTRRFQKLAFSFDGGTLAYRPII
jgi:glycine hydroxymethyltransferase